MWKFSKRYVSISHSNMCGSSGIIVDILMRQLLSRINSQSLCVICVSSKVTLLDAAQYSKVSAMLQNYILQKECLGHKINTMFGINFS